MKQYSKEKTQHKVSIFTKVVLALTLIITTTFTGLSGGFIDSAEKASASNNKYTYSFEVGKIQTGVQADLKTGDILNITVDPSKKSAIFNKVGWAFGDANGRLQNYDYFTSLFYGIDYQEYAWWAHHGIKTVKGSSASITTIGSIYFSDLKVGNQIAGFVHGKDADGYPTPYATTFTLKSKTDTSNGSCGLSSKYVYEFESAHNYMTKPLDFEKGKTWMITIDESKNSFETALLGWGIADFQDLPYSQFNKWFLDSDNPTRAYSPNDSIINRVHYFNKSNGTLSEIGMAKFKQMYVGQVLYNEGVAGYYGSSYVDLRYGKTFDLKLKSKTQEQVKCN